MQTAVMIQMAQRPKYSRAFGDLIEELYQSMEVDSNDRASDAMGGVPSGEYIRRMRRGRVPGPDIMVVLLRYFPERAEELIALSGMEDLRAAIVAPGQLGASPAPPKRNGDPTFLAITPSNTTLPLGPPIPAMAGRDLGDVVIGAERVNVPPVWVERGATIALHVDGPCLKERLQPGDLVGLKPQDYASHGDIVLARLEDGSYTLKKYVETDEGGRLTTNDTEKYPPPEGPFQIVAVMVGLMGE